MSLKQKFNLGIWNVGIIKSDIEDILNGASYSIAWMKHNYHDRFFADPFLLDVDEEYYHILAEEYVFYEGLGRIVLLKINKNSMKLQSKEYIISENWHVSYPIVYNGMIIPEAYRSGKLYGYKLLGDSLKRSIIINKPLVDPTFLNYEGIEWIFATTRETDIDAQQKLCIYYKKGSGDYVPHMHNPIKIDIRTSRPGGNFFVQDGKLYRPVQDCSERYGGQIRIMRVQKLSECAYEESEVIRISSHNQGSYNMGLHTFNVENGFIIVDGYREKSSMTKALYVKCPKLLCRLNTEQRDGRKINE